MQRKTARDERGRGTDAGVAWLCEHAGGVAVTVRVTPRAARSAIAGERDDCLLIRLQAPPVDGKANKALLAFLAESLGVPKSAVQLMAGAKSRVKRVLISRQSTDAVRRALSPPGVGPE